MSGRLQREPGPHTPAVHLLIVRDSPTSDHSPGRRRAASSSEGDGSACGGSARSVRTPNAEQLPRCLPGACPVPERDTRAFAVRWEVGVPWNGDGERRGAPGAVSHPRRFLRLV